MTEEFRAVVTRFHAEGNPTQVEMTLLEEDEFPVPLTNLGGRRVVVFPLDDLLGLLDRAANALWDHDQDHNFSESHERALAELRAVLARIADGRPLSPAVEGDSAGPRPGRGPAPGPAGGA